MSVKNEDLGDYDLISAKDMFEITKECASKLKLEKFSFVRKQISQAAEREQFTASFSFIQLKPFVGAIIERLTELGYKVAQSGQNITASWDLAPKASAKAKPATEAGFVAADEDKSYNKYDDEDDQDEDEDEYDDPRF
jgi:hypothetical protein